MAAIGHNGYSFDDVVAENLERGVYWAQRDALIRIIRDPAMSNRHEIVLAEIVAMTNAETGACYPGRRHLSETTGYTEGTIATTIKELVAAGYIVSTRKAPEPGSRALAHYAVVKPTVDDLRAAVDAHIAAIRAANTRSKEPSQIWAKVNPVIHLRKSDVNPVVHVNGTEVKPVLHVNETENGLCSKADVNPVLPTVTSSYSLLTDRPVSVDVPAKPSPHAKRVSKGTRIDPDWRLPKSWGEWALREFEISPEQVRVAAQKFHNHFKSVPGQKGLKLDWHATWQNWCGSSYQGWKRRSSSIPADRDLLSGEPEESEHDRQLAMLRKARLTDGLN